MDHINYFKDMFESIEDYRKIVLLLFLIRNDSDLVREFGFLKWIIFDYLHKIKILYLNKMKII